MDGNSIFVTAAALFLLAAAFFVGYDVGRVEVIDSCRNYSAYQRAETRIDCSARKL